MPSVVVASVSSPDELVGILPSRTGIYVVCDQANDLQFVELSRDVAASVLTHRKSMSDLCLAVKQKGTFETGQEDTTKIPDDLKLRLAYREAVVAVLACHCPDPYRPILEIDIKSIRIHPNMWFAQTPGRVFARKSNFVDSIVKACAPTVIEEEVFGIDNLCWISAKAISKASRLVEILIL